MSKLFVALALASSLLTAIGAKADDIPNDVSGFTAYVADQLQKGIGGDATVTVKGPLTLGLAGLQANLDRIYEYCKKDRNGCAKVITTYVQGAAQVYKDKNAPPSRDAVRLVVRTTTYLQQAQGSMPADAPALQPRPFVEGLVVLPVVDSPRTVRMLNEKDNRALGLNQEEVYQLGLTNLRSTLKPLMAVAKGANRGQIGQLVGDSYQPSRLILHDDWAPLAAAQNGKLIVVSPATDAVFYISEDTPRAIDALRTFARNILSRAPNRLSDTLLRWTPGGWEIVP